MPNVSILYVLFSIFEADGITPSLDTSTASDDYFLLYREIAEPVFGVIQDSDKLLGSIGQDEAKGIVYSESSLKGVVYEWCSCCVQRRR